MILFFPFKKKWYTTSGRVWSELAVICVSVTKCELKFWLREMHWQLWVTLFIGLRSTELLWNLVNSYPCSVEDMLDGISTGFYLQKKPQGLDILRNSLVVFAQHCKHSLHFREVALWSVMCFLRVFASSFNLPFDVWSSDYCACPLLRIDLYGLDLYSVLIHR